MTDPLESMFRLISARIHTQGTLLALVDAPTAERIEFRPRHPGESLELSVRDAVTKLIRAAASAGGFIALVSDGLRTAGEEWRPLDEKEIRFFRPRFDPQGVDLQLTQASRLHASVLLTRLQMRHMLPRDLVPNGPHRGYQQLFLPAPFI